ncbi:MAG TPA: hypothetical protein VMP01_29425, partial [Pirellulaceae bacterium]|nr:hypothetical protein [Pirellulaceae bacterium]
MPCARIMAVLVMAVGSGCAPLARMQVFRPATHDLAGVERIAVLQGDVADPAASDVSRAVAESLVANRSYTLVEPAVLETIHPIKDAGGTIARALALDAARQCRVDAILACEAAPGGM